MVTFFTDSCRKISLDKSICLALILIALYSWFEYLRTHSYGGGIQKQKLFFCGFNIFNVFVTSGHLFHDVACTTCAPVMYLSIKTYVPGFYTTVILSTVSCLLLSHLQSSWMFMSLLWNNLEHFPFFYQLLFCTTFFNLAVLLNPYLIA